MLHALAGVMQFGCEKGDGGSRGVPHALARKQGQAPVSPEYAHVEQVIWGGGTGHLHVPEW